MYNRIEQIIEFINAGLLAPDDAAVLWNMPLTEPLSAQELVEWYLYNSTSPFFSITFDNYCKCHGFNEQKTNEAKRILKLKAFL